MLLSTTLELRQVRLIMDARHHLAYQPFKISNKVQRAFSKLCNPFTTSCSISSLFHNKGLSNRLKFFWKNVKKVRNKTSIQWTLDGKFISPTTNFWSKMMRSVSKQNFIEIVRAVFEIWTKISKMHQRWGYSPICKPQRSFFQNFSTSSNYT